MDEDEDAILARALEVLRRRAKSTAAPSLTVRQLYDKYEAASSARKSWSTTRVKTLPFVDAHADMPVDALTVMDWTTHSVKRRQTPIPGAKDARCYGASTVNHELAAAKAMMNWAVAQGLIRFNPLAACRRTKVRKGRETAPREWEIGRALDACATTEQTVMVLAAADLGMRRGEIIQLQHDWIDHEAKTVTLPGYACKNGRGGTIPATQRFLVAVSRLPRHIRYPQVLVSERGKGPFSRMALDSWWRDIRERAGLVAAPGDVAPHLHDLRAACATNAVERGVRLPTVSKRIMRHASLKTTEIYLRRPAHDPDETAAAVAAFEAGIIRDQKRR